MTLIHATGIEPPEDRSLGSWERAPARASGVDPGAEGVTPDDGCPSEKLGVQWVQVFGRLEPLAWSDPVPAGDDPVRGAESAIEVSDANDGWRHRISKYLGRPGSAPRWQTCSTRRRRGPSVEERP